MQFTHMQLRISCSHCSNLLVERHVCSQISRWSNLFITKIYPLIKTYSSTWCFLEQETFFLVNNCRTFIMSRGRNYLLMWKETNRRIFHNKKTRSVKTMCKAIRRCCFIILFFGKIAFMNDFCRLDFFYITEHHVFVKQNEKVEYPFLY